MPYELKGNCVVKKASGKAVPGGCHKTHAQALAHLRALEIHVEDVLKKESTLVFKEVATGKPRWVAIASGAYGPDRDGQWVTEKALKDWVERLNGEDIPLRANGEPVVARWWHVGKPDIATRSKGFGIDLGVCDTAIFHSHSLLLSGTFYDDKVGEAFATSKEKLGVSVSFFHPVDEAAQKEFRTIDIFEVSFLPVERASYPLTALAITEGEK